MTVDHEAAKKKARFWDQWSQDECRLMAEAYLEVAAQLAAAHKAAKFHVCRDHLNVDWNQPELDDDHCILCRLFYLEAQEGLLEEWQQRAKKAEETIEEIERPLDAKMARLNKTVESLNEEKIGLAFELEAAKKDAARYRWVLGKWKDDSDEACEEHDDALNADDPDAAIDAAIREGK